MEQSTHVHRSIIAIFIKTFLLIIFLSIGLYFGIRLGEGYYNFYQPTSPYYQNAVSQASHDSYNAGWNDGFRAGDDFETIGVMPNALQIGTTSSDVIFFRPRRRALNFFGS